MKIEGEFPLWKILNRLSKEENWKTHKIEKSSKRSGKTTRYAGHDYPHFIEKTEFKPDELYHVGNYHIQRDNDSSQYLLTDWYDGNGFMSCSRTIISAFPKDLNYRKEIGLEKVRGLKYDQNIYKVNNSLGLFSFFSSVVHGNWDEDVKLLKENYIDLEGEGCLFDKLIQELP